MAPTREAITTKIYGVFTTQKNVKNATHKTR